LLGDADRAFARSLVIEEAGDLIAFDKPAGLAVQGGSGVTRSLEDLLAAFARSNGKRPKLVHRLDRETSGVIVAARTTPDAARLSAAFAGRTVRKAYLALVAGDTPPALIELPLLRGRDSRGLEIMRPVPGGGPLSQPATTRVTELARRGRLAAVLLEPVTGRMHQLRAHLAAVGAPILGDPRYGGPGAAEGVEVGRLALHAAALGLPDPGGVRVLHAPLPADLSGAFSGLVDPAEALQRAIVTAQDG
jgi:tRNA pseudouridine32 synthase/23S rRNA pseudouridine746 synthase